MDMSEDRKECHKCLSFNRCFGGADYGSIYCVANRKYRQGNDSIYDTKLAVMQQQINEKDKRIQELENKLLDVIHGTEIIKNETPEYIKENYIPKQIIREKIKDLQYNNTLGFEETLEESFKIEVLQELLEGEK